jgi:sigma-B regulation protein RsbU (phosphoserine phosphatase)
MRILPRIHIPQVRRIKRKLRQLSHRLTVARAVILVELLGVIAAMLFMYTGGRAAQLDRIGRRADLFMFFGILLVFGALHVVARRRLIPALERRFSPAPYDERRILFDLGQEARAATNIDHLYKSIVGRISEALGTENVSIFALDDRTGHYFCRISSTDLAPHQAGEHQDKTTAAARPVIRRDAFVVRRLQHMTNPLVIEEAELESWDRALDFVSRATREARKAERATLLEIKSRLLVQIRIKEQLVGILSIGPRRKGHAYSAADKEMLMSVAGQLAFVIENSKLVERMIAEERLLRELALAAEVQQRLFPAGPPASAFVELAGFCQPARGVGGDYYDFLEFGDGQLAVAIADVAGKGVSAALLMSSVQASLRSQTISSDASARAVGSVVGLVSMLNRLLCRSTGSATYVTFFYAQLDEQARRLTYVNAGHNPPFLLRANGSAGRKGLETNRAAPRYLSAAADGETAAVDEPASEVVAINQGGQSARSNGHDSEACLKLTTGGPVIGMFEWCQYEQEVIALESGDLVVAFTDGVTEALNVAGEEFGEERLEETLSAATHLSASEVRDFVVKSVQDWCANAPQHDDLTFLVIKVK